MNPERLEEFKSSLTSLIEEYSDDHNEKSLEYLLINGIIES